MINLMLIISITTIWAFILIPGFNEYTVTMKVLILWSLDVIACIIYGGGKPTLPRWEIDEGLAKILRISCIIYIVTLGFNGSAVGNFSKSATLFFSGNLVKQVTFYGVGAQ